MCVWGGDLYLLNEKSLLYVCTWPCAYIYHNSSNWWGVMINDVVDEKHPAAIITKDVHKHTKLWNSERWWSFSDTIIAGRVWSACCILGWSGYHWRRALVTHLLWHVMWCLWKTHVVWSMGGKNMTAQITCGNFQLSATQPSIHTHTHTVN